MEFRNRPHTPPAAFFWMAAALLLMAGCPDSFPAVFADSAKGLAWKDADGRPVNFDSPEQLEEFLLTASVVKKKRAPSGTTAPLKVLLEKDGVRLYACFRHVSIHRQQIRLANGKVAFNFRDDAVFELAAYRLARLLGYPNIPPTVARRVGGVSGTLQAWVPDSFTEQVRLELKRQPANPQRWVWEIQAMQLFDALIFNEDRNLGNVLFDARGALWMIDHTRAFRNFTQVPGLKAIRSVERNVWHRLTWLTDEAITEELGRYLTGPQVRALLQRRAEIVLNLDRAIRSQGEEQVLFDLWSPEAEKG